MRRLAGNLLMLCSAASLLLGIATLALWARSRAHIDVVRGAGPVDAAFTQTCDHFYSGEGVICLWRVRCEHSTGPVTEMMGSGFSSFPTSGLITSRPFSGFRPRDSRVVGFGAVRSVTTDPATGPWERRWTYWALSVPHWFVALLLVAAPARPLTARVVRWSRRRAGSCLACGYDLRASPERCPECGAVAGGSGA